MHVVADMAAAVCRSVQAASVPAIRVVAAMQPLNALAFVGDGVYQGAKDFAYLAAATAGACCAAAAVMVAGDGSLVQVCVVPACVDRPTVASLCNTHSLVQVWIALAVLQAGRGLGVTARWLGLSLWGFGPSPLLVSGEGAVSTALLEESEDSDSEPP